MQTPLTKKNLKASQSLKNNKNRVTDTVKHAPDKTLGTIAEIFKEVVKKGEN